MPGENNTSLKNIFSQATEAEKNNDTKKATELYKNITEQDNLNIPAYDKLMKIFRKSREYKKELSIIDKAIKAYTAYYKIHKPRHSKKVDSLSAKLNKSLGLVDKKGVSTFDPEPLGKWKKRKLVVEKKLNK